MSLFWIINKHDDGELKVFLQEARSIVIARVRASFSGHNGDFVEARALDAEAAKKVPPWMIGHVLCQSEAAKLLGRLGMS